MQTVHTFLRGFNRRHRRYNAAVSMMRTRIAWGTTYRELAQIHGVAISTAWRWTHAAAEWSDRQAEIKVSRSWGIVTDGKGTHRIGRITRIKRGMVPKVRRSLPRSSVPSRYSYETVARTDDTMLGTIGRVERVDLGLIAWYEMTSKESLREQLGLDM